MSKVVWRHQYDEQRDAVERAATDITCMDESRTIQDAPDSDINELMRRFGVKDGSILPGQLGNYDPALYGDFTDVPDLRTALDRTHNAEEAFMMLPAKLRAEFNNNPWQLAEWIHQEGNIDRAVELGLLQKREPAPETPKPTPQPPEASGGK